MHGNQWVLKIAVLKFYSVSKRGTTAKSNPKQATDPISLHTKFGDNSSNTFPLNERKPCMTPDIGRRTSDGEKSKNNISTPQRKPCVTPDIGRRTSDGEKSKNNISTPYPMDNMLYRSAQTGPPNVRKRRPVFPPARRSSHCTRQVACRTSFLSRQADVIASFSLSKPIRPLVNR